MNHGLPLFAGVSFVVLMGCQLRVESDKSPERGTDSDSDSWNDDSNVWVPPPTATSAPWPSSPPSANPSSSSAPSSSPAPDPSRPVDPLRELVVIDPTVVQSEYASNATEGAPFSFRTQMAWLSGSEDDALAFTIRWLEHWETVTSAGDYGAPVEPRPSVRKRLIDRWLAPVSSAQAPYYQDDADRQSAWRTAPFLLIAIVNRIDLAFGPVCDEKGGELRFVYAVLDPVTRFPLSMTVIVEIPYPPAVSTQGWARAWHDVAARPFGSAYNQLLASLTRRVSSGADPRDARVRTNEQAFGFPWELREFTVDDAGGSPALSIRPLELTPRNDVDPKLIDTHVLARSNEIVLGPVPLPAELRAGAAQTVISNFRWTSNTLNASLMQSFSRETCNGCHGGEAEALPFQHIALDPSGVFPARLSRFLKNPLSSTDELSRRASFMAFFLSSSCTE